MTINRTDAESAAEVIQNLMPKKPARQVCLEFLANSIRIADGLSPSRWGVTLTEELIRLNVGHIEVLAFYSGIVHCLLDLNTIPKRLRKDKRVDLFENEIEPAWGYYQSVPGSVICNLIVRDAKEILPVIQGSHHLLVEKAAKTGRHPMTRKAHSPAVIDYLSSYLGRELPYPDY